MVYDCDLSSNYSIIGQKVREAVSRNSRLAILNSHQTRLDSLADINLKVNQRTSVDLLEAMLQYILSYDMVDQKFIESRTTGFQNYKKQIMKLNDGLIARIPWVKPAKIIEVIHLYIRAKNPVIIVNGDSITSIELALLNNLALIAGNIGREGSGILILYSNGNAQGLLDMGVRSGFLPGHSPVSSQDRQRFADKWKANIPGTPGGNSVGILSEIERGEIQGLVVVGREALGGIGTGIFEVPIFSVLIDSVMPANPPYPVIALPGAAFVESEGTFTNSERRVQRIRQAVKPPSGKQNWEIISALSNELGYPMNYQSTRDIFDEIAEMVSMYAEVRENESAGKSTQWTYSPDNIFDIDGGLAHFRSSEFKANEIRDMLKILI
jgi:predicted molibdopterin-dependent oxidoreductase YjgC